MRPLHKSAPALALGALLALPAIAAAQKQQATTTRTLGIDTTNFDRSIRPQDDFFRFVNGGWLKKTEIPSDASSWGAFNELDREEPHRDRTRILEDAATTQCAGDGTERRKSR